MIEQAKVLEMLTLQDEINTRIAPNWRALKHPWYRAIWVEAAELLDHQGYKWWKHQEPDINQIRLELIDIWHFGLSDMICSYSEWTLGEIANYIVAMFPSKDRDMTETVDGSTLIERFAEKTLRLRGFDLHSFGRLCAHFGLGLNDLHKHYIGKNVLNLFRQNNGYKEGAYVKVWQGREDNEHLAEIMENTQIGVMGITMQEVYTLLDARYQRAKEDKASFLEIEARG